MYKSYEELIKLKTFEERFDYLSLDGAIGVETFGFDRYLNQVLYRSSEWRSLRDQVIIRDKACDLGIEDREILGRVIIHHINPISKEDIVNRNPRVMDLNNLICVSHNTHEAIHYGNSDLLISSKPIIRYANDTCPWR